MLQNPTTEQSQTWEVVQIQPHFADQKNVNPCAIIFPFLGFLVVWGLFVCLFEIKLSLHKLCQPCFINPPNAKEKKLDKTK